MAKKLTRKVLIDRYKKLCEESGVKDDSISVMATIVTGFDFMNLWDSVGKRLEDEGYEKEDILEAFGSLKKDCDAWFEGFEKKLLGEAFN